MSCRTIQEAQLCQFRLKTVDDVVQFLSCSDLRDYAERHLLGYNGTSYPGPGKAILESKDLSRRCKVGRWFSCVKQETEHGTFFVKSL
jgi:hypothetical protein